MRNFNFILFNTRMPQRFSEISVHSMHNNCASSNKKHYFWTALVGLIEDEHRIVFLAKSQ